jgi:hypothetical protein
VVALSPGNSHSFLSQDVAYAALGDGFLELAFKEIGQFLLREGRVLSFLLPQPDPTLRSHLVRVAVAMVNECFPARPSLAIATAEVRERSSAEGET